MSIQDMLLEGGGSLILIMTLIQISPIQIDPWSWIANSIGNAINKGLSAKIDDLSTKVDSIETKVNNLETQVNNLEAKVDALDNKITNVDTKVDTLDEKVDEVERRNIESDIILCRSRMLRFGDEILHGQKHSKDHFDQILLDCTDYQNYCVEHPGFRNNITEHTIELINNTYDKCLIEKSFL